MRQILIERARARHAAKRGGDQVRVTFDPGLIVAARESLDVEALDDALTRLATLDPDLARIVESAILRRPFDRGNRGGPGDLAGDR